MRILRAFSFRNTFNKHNNSYDIKVGLDYNIWGGHAKILPYKCIYTRRHYGRHY